MWIREYYVQVLPQMIKRSDASEWHEIQKLDLCPGVNTFGQYVEKVTQGLAKATVAMFKSPQARPSIEYIEAVHREMFDLVYPWAGQFNREGEDVWFGGMLSCHPDFIVQELEHLKSETETLLDRASTDQAKALAVAFYHAKFERIHPFRDGNGRVGRLLMQSQIIAVFGSAVHSNFVRHQYHRAIVWAQGRSNLRPLMNIVLEMAGKEALPKGCDLLPFRLAPRIAPFRADTLRRRRAKDRQ